MKYLYACAPIFSHISSKVRRYINFLQSEFSYARSNSAISNLFIFKNAAVTQASFPLSLVAIILFITVGTICQETPNLSFSHPYCSNNRCAKHILLISYCSHPHNLMSYLCKASTFYPYYLSNSFSVGSLSKDSTIVSHSV